MSYLGILVQVPFDIGYNSNGLLLDDVSLCSTTPPVFSWDPTVFSWVNIYTTDTYLLLCIHNKHENLWGREYVIKMRDLLNMYHWENCWSVGCLWFSYLTWTAMKLVIESKQILYLCHYDHSNCQLALLAHCFMLPLTLSCSTRKLGNYCLLVFILQLYEDIGCIYLYLLHCNIVRVWQCTCFSQMVILRNRFQSSYIYIFF